MLAHALRRARPRACTDLSRVLIVFLFTTALLFTTAPARAVVQTETLSLPDDGWDISRSGDLAFVAGGGLTLLDISDPLAPVKVARMSTTFRANAVLWEGDLLFVGGAGPDEAKDVQVFDVSTPEAPVLVSVEAVPGTPRSFVLVDDVLYVTGFRLPLCAIDVSDPSDPERIACVSEPEFYDGNEIASSDGLILVAGDPGGLTIYDVSDPATPTILSTNGRGAAGLALSGGLVFVQDIDVLINILDISTPAAPVQVASLPPRNAGINGDIVVRDGVAIVSLQNSFLSIDVSDPTRPIPQTEFGWREIVRHVQFLGDAFYAAGSRTTTGGAVRVYDVSNLRFPRTRSVLPTQMPRDTRLRNDMAWVVDGTGLRRFDVSDPSRPRSTTSLPFAGLFDFVMSKDALYATVNQVRRRGGLALFDLTGPNPTLASSLDTFERAESGRPRDVARQGDTLYVAHGRTGLRVFDVSDIEDPEELSDPDEPFSKGVRGLGIENDFAVLAKGTNKGIDVVDLQDPRDPVLVGHLDGRFISDEVIVKDGIAYLGLAREVVVLGVWDPTAPVELDRIDQFTNRSFTDLDLDGSRLHIGWSEGTWVVDVRDPENLQRVLAVPRIGLQEVDGIAADGRLAYASGTNGVRVIDHGPEFENIPPHLSGCPEAPNDACTPADSARLLLRRHDGKLRFRWNSPSLGTGDPIVAEDEVGFGMCLYDTRDAGAKLVWRAAILPGDRWTDGEDELAYSSPDRGPHGIRSLRLSDTSLRVRGRASAPYPLGADGSVLMQVVAATGACWDAGFDAGSFEPESDRLRARLPTP